MRYCSLSSGSNGNCHYVEQDNARVLVDLGITAKLAQTRLQEIGVDPQTIRAILVTHEHSDHIAGLGVWARRYRIPIMASPGTWEGIRRARSLGAIPGELCVEIGTGKGYKLDDLRIEAFHTFHDANDPYGYCFETQGKRLTIMTDTGMASREMEDKLKGSQLAVVESNHDVEMLMHGRYPQHLKRRVRSNMGHMSNGDCGLLLAEVLRVNPELKVLLAHLSDENNTPDIAMATVKNTIEMILGIRAEHIYLAHREDRTPVYEI